ncbi:hypothetical protein [Ehrlichia minasensis]|nr:hypothetical protein [Ehrlichia minasensis]
MLMYSDITEDSNIANTCLGKVCVTKSINIIKNSSTVNTLVGLHYRVLDM